MKKTLLFLFSLFLLNAFAGNLNLASFPSTLTISPWWTHSGSGTYKSISVKEAGNSLKCVELTGGVINLPVDTYRYSPFLYSPTGRFCKYTLNAKGKGSIQVSINAIVVNETGKTSKKSSASKTVELSDSWQKIELESQEKDPRTMKQELQIKFLSGEKALLTDSDFEYYSAPGADISIEPKTTLAKPGTQVKVRISLTKDGKPLADAPVNICVFDRPGIHLPEPGNAFGGKTQETELKTDGKGIIDYSFTPEASKYGARISAFSAPSSIAAEAFVMFADDQMIKTFDTCASSIKLQKPLSILLIGDSLSDFSRGFNYADILYACLSEKNQGMVKFTNVGVGGDFITRVWERISGENAKATGSYRRYMYEGLLDGKPDIVLIFLGHNDTRSWSDKDFKEPDILPNIQYAAYGKLLDYIKEKSPGTKVVLLSNVSSYLPIQQKNAEKAKAAKKAKYCIYGIYEFMEGFNNVLKKLAEERNLDYVDIYTTTKDAPEKENLFLPDGVHMSPKGNQLTASILMKYFAEKLLPETGKTCGTGK